jgi:hypothetical protein
MKGEKAFLARALVAGIELRTIKPSRASAVEVDGKVYRSGPAPGLFAILVNGRRVDSFLSRQRALEKIALLLGDTQ